MIPISHRNNKSEERTYYSSNTNSDDYSTSEKLSNTADSAIIHHLTTSEAPLNQHYYIDMGNEDVNSAMAEFIKNNQNLLTLTRRQELNIDNEEVKNIVEKETRKLREDLAKLLDLKIKVLPPFSSGIYLVEFENLKPYEMEKLLKMLQENINKRYNNDSIVLIGINKIKDVTETYEDEIDKEIERLQKLKKELKDIRFIC